MKISLSFFVLTAVLLMACAKKEKASEVVLWNLVVDTTKFTEGEFDRRDGRLARAFQFINDTLVDTKTPYFKLTKRKVPLAWRDEDCTFLGTKTKYYFKSDSLFTFNRTKSRWVNEGKLVKKSDSTFSLMSNEKGERHYKKTTYHVSDQPLFDRIIFSSTGCFGSCPRINISIDADGNVVYFGEFDVDSIGLFVGKIAKEEFLQLERNFRLTDPFTLGEYPQGPMWTDDFTNYVSFCRGNKVVKTVQDYGECGPSEWIWACWELKHLYQRVKIKRISKDSLAHFRHFNYYYFQAKGYDLRLEDHTMRFLLWNLIREGKEVDKEFESKYEMYAGMDMFQECNLQFETLNKYGRAHPIGTVTTDGRYFRFDDLKGHFTTIDIGLNFIDLNGALLHNRSHY
jgi:hypothetical protein